MHEARTTLTWGLAVIAGAILAVAVAGASPASALEPPIPGGIYTGTLVSAAVDCGQGDLTIGAEFELRLNPEGTRISEVVAHDVTYVGSFIGRFSISVSIAIESDGSFDDNYTAAGIADIHMDGQFDGDSVIGSFQVAASGVVQCDGIFEAHGSPPPPPSPVKWTARTDLRSNGCGGGFVSVTVAGDGLSLTMAEVGDFNAEGAVVSGSATFAEGAVPLGENGAFGWLYFPGSEPGQEIAINGSFVSGLSGLITVSPSECGPVRFQSPLPGGFDDSDGGGETNFGLDDRGSSRLSLPSTGGGSDPSDGRFVTLGLALAAVAAVALATGLAVRRRHS